VTKLVGDHLSEDLYQRLAGSHLSAHAEKAILVCTVDAGTHELDNRAAFLTTYLEALVVVPVWPFDESNRREEASGFERLFPP
jgi:hypothetical protein